MLASLAAGLTATPPALAAGPFANWAVVIVAGDWRAHDGGRSQAFDNARRDLTRAFIAEGFSPANIGQFSVADSRPAAAASARHGHKGAAGADAFPSPAPLKSDPDVIQAELVRLARQATGGCLIYVTSHGAPTGVVVGQDLLAPVALEAMIDQACGRRPTVAIISACFSGVFVPALDGPNRMVLTAARFDRTSFGCGQSDRYTYFDGCVLRSLPDVRDFAALGEAVKACVARKERETGATPPSEPQLEIGGELLPMLPLYAFASPSGAATASAGRSIGP